MLFFFTSRLISSIAAFLYPGYASYKTLSQRPASEEELERWLMYWSVLGCIVGVEYVAEWAISWIPLYYTTKTIFLLYLALPQTRGSSYLYINHLQPFFHNHESQIDATLASLKARLYAFVQEKFRTLWDQVALGGLVPHAQPVQAAQPEATGPAALVSTLWTSFGPGILASGAALLNKSNEQAPRAGGSAFRTPGPTPAPSQFRSEPDPLERKRQLEAELAQLSREMDPSGLPIPRASGTTSNSGRYEEVESDGEGYDVGDDYQAAAAVPSIDRQGGQQRGSWFGWGSGASKPGYERVKTD
ncbi:hypothetical protein BDN72DRAFT_89802 [Pluteus cervinus]|uniref:Uncharacterized protein n=1 Tax=Pluteus cervinus TaxID=181527 RepID=A0ACD3APL2_9AGAR|nr:hypothetical protein BDN72DRAFT_89802 [Pluteus cervinus]